jgi:hypothetical protein
VLTEVRCRTLLQNFNCKTKNYIKDIIKAYIRKINNKNGKRIELCGRGSTTLQILATFHQLPDYDVHI